MTLHKNSLRLTVTTIVSLLWLFLVTQYEIVATVFFVLLMIALVTGVLMSAYGIFKYFADKKNNADQNPDDQTRERNYPLYNAMTLTVIGMTGLTLVLLNLTTLPLFIPSATLTLVLPLFLIADKSS